MPRYFFNIVVRGRKAIPDPEGDLLFDNRTALRHAQAVASEMLERRRRYRRGLEHWAFEVTDERGRLVGLVSFSSPTIRTGRNIKIRKATKAVQRREAK